jgi:hypothetical protein
MEDCVLHLPDCRGRWQKDEKNGEAAAGTSLCRICGQANGSVELTDGVRFAWPEGLAHYVEAHNVRLPAEVTAAMTIAPQPVDVTDLERRLLDTNELIIDADWWRDLKGC